MRKFSEILAKLSMLGWYGWSSPTTSGGNQIITTICVYSDVHNHLEFESQYSEAILMLQGLGDLLVVNVPVNHVELHGVPLQSCVRFLTSIDDTALLVTIYRVL